MSLQEFQLYDFAIKSAKTKYDHEDTFFAKGVKGVLNYSTLIAKACLDDIKINEKDKEAMNKHNDLVKQMIRDDSIAYNRSKKKY